MSLFILAYKLVWVVAKLVDSTVEAALRHGDHEPVLAGGGSGHPSRQVNLGYIQKSNVKYQHEIYCVQTIQQILQHLKLWDSQCRRLPSTPPFVKVENGSLEYFFLKSIQIQCKKTFFVELFLLPVNSHVWWIPSSQGENSFEVVVDNLIRVAFSFAVSHEDSLVFSVLGSSQHFWAKNWWLFSETIG